VLLSEGHDVEPGRAACGKGYGRCRPQGPQRRGELDQPHFRSPSSNDTLNETVGTQLISADHRYGVAGMITNH
jgi:hypothetical protein